MAKGRTTAVIGVRVPDSVNTKVKARAERIGLTVSEYVKTLIIREVGRSHHKKSVNTIRT